MVKKAIFAPNYLVSDTQIDRFRGIYMPYWVYNFAHRGEFSVPGETSRRRGDYVYTSHYRMRNNVDATYSGISYDAASEFSDNLSGAIAPFDTGHAQMFSPAYLSGFYADAGDVPQNVYEDNALDMVSHHAAHELSKQAGYGSHGVGRDDIAKKLKFRAREAQMGFFPVWFMSCLSKNGKRVSYAVVNGQTGKVAADLPIDFKKYLLGSLALAVPLFVLLNLFLTLTPFMALLISIVLSLACMLISNFQLDQIYVREQHLDDEGYVTAHKLNRNKNKVKKRAAESKNSKEFLNVLKTFGTWVLMAIAIPIIGAFGSFIFVFVILGAIAVSIYTWVEGLVKDRAGGINQPGGYVVKEAMPFQQKIPTLIKPFIGVLAAIVILIVNPALDLWFYGVATGCMLLIIWSFLDIIKGHNMLTTRPIPQMVDKRGGDERV
ncbi:MAG: efflux RND transporter permease subunit [Coriobacteriales bacterium]|nr:efflux RND transporter permease subunit [Coriobacteriales bacterium]